MTGTTTLVGGLHFGEGPRWHNGRLWFSDFYDHAVKSVGSSGDLRIELQLDDQPSGLGWLPDGRLLLVAMQSMKLLRLDAGALVEHADVSRYSAHMCNDMVVDGHGRAWVGNFGFNLDAMLADTDVQTVLANPPTTNIVRVDPDGSVHKAAADMRFPNGTVVSADGNTLIIAETLGNCLTAFDIAADGSLLNRREWAALGQCAPDGICLDSNGNVWVANALAPECLLIAEGGAVLRRIATSQNCYACMLGGEDGKTLFMITAQFSDKAHASALRTGKVETALVDAPGAGWP